MKKTLLFFLLWGLTTGIGICQEKTIQEEQFSKIASSMFGVPDEIYWRGERYLVNEPFLSQFSGHEKLYPEVPGVEIQTFNGYRPGQTYYPVWLLQDGILYLRTINFYVDYEVVKKIFPNYEGQYRIIEELTKHKFQKNLANLSHIKEPVEGQLGSMKAAWVNGVYYIKPSWRKNWDQLPLEKLTFKDGKLISIEKIKPPTKNSKK